MRRQGLSLACLLVAAGCGGGTPTEPKAPPTPTTLALVSGDGQTGIVGQPLPVAPVVRVLDQAGNGMSGVTLTYAVTQGGGTLAATSGVTDGSGQASLAWTLGTTAGPASQRLTVTASGLTTSLVITASADAGPIRSVAVVSGDGQEGPPGIPLPTSLRAVARDIYGNPTPGRVLTWTVTGGGALIGTTPTGDNGEATANWLLGTASVQTVVASAAGAGDNIAVFTALPTGAVAVTISATFLYNSPAWFAEAFASVRATLPGLAPPRQGVEPVNLGPEDELLVVFRPQAFGLPPMAAQALAAPERAEMVGAQMVSRLEVASGPEPLDVLGVSPAILTARVRASSIGAVPRVRAALTADPSVVAVERNFRVSHTGREAAPRRLAGPFRTSVASLPNDPDYRLQSWHYHAIDLPDAWDITTGNPAVLVAVVDDGIRFDHPDLAGRLTADGYDFVSGQNVPLCTGGVVNTAGDGNGYDPDPTIPVARPWNSASNCAGSISANGGHGLHVAGTIAAGAGNGVGGIGVAPNVRIRPVRVLDITGSGPVYDIAQGILYAAGLPADNGVGGLIVAPSPARIINLSLGSSQYSAVQHAAVVAASNAGALVVAAAGNDNVSSPHYPAALPEAMSVVALNVLNDRAPYSNWGNTVNISAPGGDLDIGTDNGVYSTRWNFVTQSPAYMFLQGTSMAAPHVSGVAALLLSHQPGLSRIALQGRLESFAVDFGPAGWDNVYGFGIVNARNALTQSMTPPARRLVRAYHGVTGAVRDIGQVAGSSFNLQLPAGPWHLFVGEDANGDGVVGAPSRRWGTMGITAAPQTLAVVPGQTLQGLVTLGFPVESEPNLSAGNATFLPLGGYLFGTLTAGDTDLYRLRVPATGLVTVETGGWLGAACAFAISPDTRLTLMRENLSVISINDDIDATNWCSRISAVLDPGTYYVQVSWVTPPVNGLVERVYTVRAY